MERWEKQVKDYEALTGKEVDADIKISVLQEKLAPLEVQEHLYLHAARLTTYDLMLEEIKSYVLAKRGGVEADDDDAMDVGAVNVQKGVCRLFQQGKCTFGKRWVLFTKEGSH